MGKVAKFFIKVFIGLIDTVAVLELCMGEEAGGLNMNQTLTLLIWLGVMYILIKVNAYLSFGVAIGVYLIMRVLSTGSLASINGYLYLFGAAAVIFVIYLYAQRRISIDIKVGNKWIGGYMCPKCMNTERIMYHGEVHDTHTVHRDEVGYHGGTSILGFFNTGKWYDEGDIITEVKEAYYQCPNCGRKWTDTRKKL